MDFSATELSLGNLELWKLEAVVELMFLAAYADGSVSEVERGVFKKHIKETTLGQVSEATIDAMVTAIEASLAKEGREHRLSSIRKRLGDERTRRAALDIAIRVLRADRIVDASETAFLVRAAEALEIPVDAALDQLRAAIKSG